FDTSWKTLNSGLMCPDKIWRQIVTLQDAVDHGWDLTDIDEIREENSPEEYDNLYACTFIKNGETAFD
ncbi:terminase family protein, partial [Klebsiella pneumoniae]